MDQLSIPQQDLLKLAMPSPQAVQFTPTTVILRTIRPCQLLLKTILHMWLLVPKKDCQQNSILLITADVLLTRVECEAAKITAVPIIQDPGLIGPSSRTTVEASSCTDEGVYLLARDPKRFLCSPQQIVA